MVKAKKKVLIITHVYGTFVKRDVAILRKKYDVKCHTYSGEKDIFSNFLGQIKLFFWLLRHIGSSYAVYIWFADYHAFLPVLFARIFGKRSFMVEGGYDTVAIPELKYGSHVNPLRSKMSIYAMQHVGLNLPVSETLSPEIKTWAPGANIEHLYTGLDHTQFFPKGKKDKMVLTVAGKISSQRAKIKGVDWFVGVAREFPELSFVIIGSGTGVKTVLEPLPDNVTITGKLPNEDLINYFQRAMIYAQFSIREGLPTAVMEAMLCECVPVGFRAGGIPVAIGEAGVIVEKKDIKDIVVAMNKALDKHEILGPKARERVIQTFPESKREKRLFEIMEK